MGLKVYKKRDDKKQEEKISLLFIDMYLNKNQKLFKNYILEMEPELMNPESF